MKNFISLFVLLSSVSAAAQLSSPRLEELRLAVANNPGALRTFWNEIATSGAPLVEEVHGTNDVLVTFVLRSEAALENALVFASVLPENDPDHQRLVQLPGTDVWFRTFRFGRNVPSSTSFPATGQKS